MSGSAALSAARKRRASTQMTPSSGGGVGVGSNTPQSGSYYSKQSLQGIMNQSPAQLNPAAAAAAAAAAFTLPKETAPNVPINIYENIELIKQQLAERSKLIQTQGSSIPPDKLRVLQKQNEIQAQILRQKMMIVQQMELAEQQKQQEAQQRQPTVSRFSLNPAAEPEFIYEKGIPRKNPKYRKPEEVAQAQAPAPGQAQAQAQAQAKQVAPILPPHQNSRHPISSPFISMITDTGVIPPPIVILKSHDATLETHHHSIQELFAEIEELHSVIQDRKGEQQQMETIQEEEHSRTRPRDNGRGFTAFDDSKADANADGDQATDTEELLMDVVMNDLTNSREFIEGVVNKIVNETNLSEVIMKIEPIIKENQELRSLLHSQQLMMNEMNTMLLRLLNGQQGQQGQQEQQEHEHEHEHEHEYHDEPTQELQEGEYRDEGLDSDGLYGNEEVTEIILSVQNGHDEPAAVDENKSAVEELSIEPEASVEQDAQADAQAEQEQEAEAEPEPEPEPEADAEQDAPAEQEQETAAEPEPEQEIDYHSISLTEEECSDTPHFPEQINLIIREL